jgi:hypothetical protein
LNKINDFQSRVAKSGLFKYLKEEMDTNDLEKEANELDKSLMSKGFFFNPMEEKEFKGLIKVDFNTAYWQTCRYMRMIDRNFYRNVVRNCIKDTRLKITGTLGKVNYMTPYDLGKKGKTFVREEAKRRIIFRNIYERIRKFVDEMMVWCWMRDPQNFVGFYVDCVWLREYDVEMLSRIRTIFDYKVEHVDMRLEKNHHGKLTLVEKVVSGPKKGELTPYDVKIKSNEFVSYKFFHNFSPELKSIKFKTTGWNKQLM